MSKDWTGNYHSVCGCLGAHNECKEDREENDFYATQPIAAEWLIKLENLDNNIWECACGQGHLGKVFEEHGTVTRYVCFLKYSFLKARQGENSTRIAPPYGLYFVKSYSMRKKRRF